MRLIMILNNGRQIEFANDVTREQVDAMLTNEDVLDLGSVAPASGTRARRSRSRSDDESRGSCGLRSGPGRARP